MIGAIRQWCVNRVKSLQDRLAARRILVLGDSHAEVFRIPWFRLHMPRTAFDVCAVAGATVSGLENPNSTTRAMEVFERKLSEAPDADYALLLIGEVDTGFVIWYRAQKYGTPVDEMVDQALARYEALMRRVAESYPLIVMSVPLPTISDDNNWGEVANERQAVTTTQAERTRLTLAFNRRLAEVCKGLAWFIDLDDESLGPDGRVAPVLLNADHTDHHYDQEVYARLIRSHLNRVFQARGSGRS